MQVSRQYCWHCVCWRKYGHCHLCGAGTDCTLHVEIMIDGAWRHWNEAGVRGDASEAIAPPRGLPEDATFETAFQWARETVR